MWISEAVTSKLIKLFCFFFTFFSHPDNEHPLFQHRSGSSDLRSQTPSPHFGPLTMNVPKNVNDRDIYRSNTIHTESVNQSLTNRNMINMELTSARVPSPHQVWFRQPHYLFSTNSHISVTISLLVIECVSQDVRGPSPVHNFLENIRGPLPPAGPLLGMKAGFHHHRCSRSPLNFPLFPLNSQRRWSEAAANTLQGEPSMMDTAENMRRWSMPWESKSDRNTVTWHQTRVISRMAMPPNTGGHAIYSKASSDRSQTTTPGTYECHDAWNPKIQLKIMRARFHFSCA